jgi:hypothetical protein
VKVLAIVRVPPLPRPPPSGFPSGFAYLPLQRKNKRNNNLHNRGRLRGHMPAMQPSCARAVLNAQMSIANHKKTLAGPQTRNLSLASTDFQASPDHPMAATMFPGLPHFFWAFLVFSLSKIEQLLPLLSKTNQPGMLDTIHRHHHRHTQ